MNKTSEEEFQSAKVYVFDFHFSSHSKMFIARKKEELDKFFDNLRDELQKEHSDLFVKSDVFLRKH
jgi:hypothetical protein